MERQWEVARPLAFQTRATGIIVAACVLLLSALGLTMGALARHVGVLIGEAVAAVVRAMFSALGVLLPGQGLEELQRAPLVNVWRAAMRLFGAGAAFHTG